MFFWHFFKFYFLDLQHGQKYCNNQHNGILLIVFTRDSRDFGEAYFASQKCKSEQNQAPDFSSLRLWLRCDSWRELSCLTRRMPLFLPRGETPALEAVAAGLLSSHQWHVSRESTTVISSSSKTSSKLSGGSAGGRISSQPYG